MAKNKAQSPNKVVHDSKLIDVSKKTGLPRVKYVHPDKARLNAVFKTPRRHRRGNASMGGLA